MININIFDPNNIKTDEKSLTYSYLQHWICGDQRLEIYKN